MSSQKPCSSERVPKTLTDATMTEREQNRTERIENGYGMDMERVQNRTNLIQNGNENACGTAIECVLSSIPCLVSSDRYCREIYYKYQTSTINNT